MIPQTTAFEAKLRQAIILTITYADVFDYPLTAAEIHRYLDGLSATSEHVSDSLHQAEKIIKIGEYYCLPGRESIVTLRKKRELKSAALWRYAIRYGQRIARLPYVHLVAVTGSLAMNNIDSQADIDYLIVTEPGHLWLCRAMVHILRRVIRLRGHNLCPNYLITTQALSFPDRNLYAAHELAQMVPLSGMEVYTEIRQQNEWVYDYLPNAVGLPSLSGQVVLKGSKSWLRPILEAILQSRLAVRIEQWEMNRKILMLSHEQSESPESCFSPDCCKGHANRHGLSTDAAFHERLKGLILESLP